MMDSAKMKSNKLEMKLKRKHGFTCDSRNFSGLLSIFMIFSLERQSSVLYDEIKILQKVSVQREKLDALNKRKNDREAELDKM